MGISLFLEIYPAEVGDFGICQLLNIISQTKKKKNLNDILYGARKLYSHHNNFTTEFFLILSDFITQNFSHLPITPIPIASF